MKNIFDFGVLLNLIKRAVCNIFGASKIYFDWDSTKTYDANVIITYKDNNGISHLYLSKQPVPVGVQIINTNYWELVEGMIRDTVKYTEQLGKTSLEKTIARSNIGAASDTKVLEVENLAKDAVKYTEQLGKTSLEKTIARSNIGAASDTKVLEVESIAKGAQRAFSIENYQSLVSFLNISSQGVYSLGQSIYVKTLDVPDLWVYQIEDTKVTYQYVSDEAFVSDLTTYGSVKMGYYRVAMLETLKINLDNYITTTDYANLDTGGVVKVDMSKGIKINNGTIETIPAESLNLNAKTGSYSIVTPTNLDIAVKATTHQDMSEEYDIDTIITNASYTESKGYLPVSYDAVKGYVDTKADKQTEAGGFLAGEGASNYPGGTGAAIGKRASTSSSGIAIGEGSNSYSGIAVGKEASASFSGAVAIGVEAVGASAGAVAIGSGAASVMDNIQLGAGVNEVLNSLQIYDKQLLDADGYIPIERIADGVITLAKMADDVTDELDSNILNGVTTHNEDSDSHPSILSDLVTIDAIARGKANAKVFDTVEDMNTWLAVSENIEGLNIGDNLYIRDLLVPDYWWDGIQAQELEAESVNLSDYYTKTEVDTRLPIVIEQSDYDALVIAGTLIAGRIYYVVADGELT